MPLVGSGRKLASPVNLFFWFCECGLFRNVELILHQEGEIGYRCHCLTICSPKHSTICSSRYFYYLLAYNFERQVSLLPIYGSDLHLLLAAVFLFLLHKVWATKRFRNFYVSLGDFNWNRNIKPQIMFMQPWFLFHFLYSFDELL